MCGVLGYKTKSGVKLSGDNLILRKNISKALFLAMSQRGKDSTGVAVIEKGKCKIYKDIVSSDNFIDDKNVNKLLEKDCPVMIGHTRFATVGVIKKENAHPFQKGNIVGCHNGSVQNYLEFDNCQVDSEVIFTELDKDGNKFHKTFKKLSGDFAILWSNLAEPENLYFVAHDNPLAVAQVPELKTYFLCSHEIDLEVILRATGLRYYIFNVKEDRVYKIDQENKMIEDKIKFKKDMVYCSTTAWDDYGYKKEDLNGDYIEDEEREYQVEELQCMYCGTGIIDRFYYNDYTSECVCEDCFPEMKEYGYAGGYTLLELSNKTKGKKYGKV